MFNASFNDERFFSIANNTLVVVFIKPFKIDVVQITLGQIMSVLG